MAKGDKILTSSGKTTITKIKAMQSKWGLAQISDSVVTQAAKVTTNTTNQMIDAIVAGKTKSGWGGSVSGKVSVENLITDIFASLNSQADAITSHCPCNCNYCSCNCNHCSCNCNKCESCSSNCDSSNN